MRLFLLLVLLLPTVPTGADEDRGLLGVWREVDSADDQIKTIEITPSHWAVATGGKLQYLALMIRRTDGEVVASVFCNRVMHEIELGKDEMTVTFTPTRTKFNPAPEEATERYVRLTERPEYFDLTALPLGDPGDELTGERRRALRQELEERGEHDQKVREKFTKPGAEVTE